MKLKPYKSGENALCLLDLPSLRHKNLCEKLKQSENLNISCLEDNKLNATPYKCEIGSVSFVLGLLARLSFDLFKERLTLTKKFKASDLAAIKSLDEGYLSAEACLGEEEGLEILEFLDKKAKFLIFDENLLRHKDFKNIAFLMGFLCENFNLTLACSDENITKIQQAEFSELKELESFDGLVLCPLKSENLLCSRQFLQIAKVQDGDEVEIKSKDFTFKSKIQVDENLQGTVGFLDFKPGGYDFVQVSIKKAAATFGIF